MNVEPLTSGTVSIVERKSPLSSVGEATHLVSACAERSTNRLLLDSPVLPPAFFELHTLFAGELLQKLHNYRLRTAVAISPDRAYGKRFDWRRSNVCVHAHPRLTPQVEWTDQQLRCWLPSSLRSSAAAHLDRSLGHHYLLVDQDDLCVLCFCLATSARYHTAPGANPEAIMFARVILAELASPTHEGLGERIIRQVAGHEAGWYLVLKSDYRADVRRRSQRTRERFAVEIGLARVTMDWLAEELSARLVAARNAAARGVYCNVCNTRYSIEQLVWFKVGESRSVFYGCPKCRANFAYYPDEDAAP